MNQKAKNIFKVLGILLVFILALLLIWWLTEDRSTSQLPEDDINNVRNQPRAEDVFTPDQINQAIATPVVNSRIFAERFGSFSSQANFGNVADVENITTPELFERLENLALSGSSEPAENFYSISTRVISSEIIEQTENSATVTVLTQRTEATGTPSNRQERMQNMTLSLQLVGNTWLISDYAWAE